MRVGLYGGSFNPPHEAHRHVADTGRKALGLNKVIWLVSPQNPLKSRGMMAPLAERMAATRALANRPADIVSDVESSLGSPYTIDTITWFRRRWPGVRFFWLTGSDNLVSLHHWRRWRDIPGQMEIAIIPRPGSTVRGRLAPGGRLLAASGRARFIEAPLHTASSTAIRERAMRPS